MKNIEEINKEAVKKIIANKNEKVLRILEMFMI